MVNKAILIGTVDRDAKLRYLPTGSAVCEFTLLISHSYTNKSGQQKTSKLYQPVVVWGDKAEAISQQALKGALVSVQGRLQNKQWVDQQNQKHNITEVVADLFDGVTVLSGVKQDSERPAPKQDAPAPGDDEVPF